MQYTTIRAAAVYWKAANRKWRVSTSLTDQFRNGYRLWVLIGAHLHRFTGCRDAAAGGKASWGRPSVPARAMAWAAAATSPPPACSSRRRPGRGSSSQATAVLPAAHNTPRPQDAAAVEAIAVRRTATGTVAAVPARKLVALAGCPPASSRRARASRAPTRRGRRTSPRATRPWTSRSQRARRSPIAGCCARWPSGTPRQSRCVSGTFRTGWTCRVALRGTVASGKREPHVTRRTWTLLTRTI